MPSHDLALLTGERIFGAPLDSALLPNVDVLGLNEVVVLDFNVIQQDGDHPRREVSDNHAASFYCANHAIERLPSNKVHDGLA